MVKIGLAKDNVDEQHLEVGPAAGGTDEGVEEEGVDEEILNPVTDDKQPLEALAE